MSKHLTEVSDGTFEKDVLQSERPVLVDFGAPWCPPCRMIEPAVEALAKEFEGSASFFKMNIDDNPAVPQRYGIKGIPTLIVFSGGREVERIVGASSKESIARVVAKHTAAVAV